MFIYIYKLLLLFLSIKIKTEKKKKFLIMPAVTVEAPQRSEQMWQALKIHITNERQRKRQEQEADAEEERRRKERERQQKQDVMTLGETRDQISNLEAELSQLKSEKHQLFLQLKKVLNEDDNRRRLTKESSVCTEAMTVVGGYSASGPSTHSQLFLPLPTRSPLYKVPTVAPTHNILPTVNGPIKRTHSPSPPPIASPYHAVYGYKPPPSIPNYNPPLSKSEEAARRSGDSRAVLWNKNNQYPPSTFYSTPSNQMQYSYSAVTSHSREQDHGKAIYLANSRPTIPTHQQAYVTSHHPLDHKNAYVEDKYYLRPGSHIAVHGGAIPIQQPPQGAKSGSITSGYPVRPPQAQTMSYPPPPLPSGAYNQNRAAMPGRLVYTQPGILYRILQREI
ncbi:LOW QUALITY PROTEIN: G protein pathway suppressor 2 [Aphidius gifuensis]|uniref:LOW QUALITY PROTEIN: G protein pathway suppressor 2 n=1 Tax=Aphidius gifuensis TaxID=684658 RepID=UPI001CDD2A55|nr:LOW QUALITY PROTEIN: G protein pathway suppressor 2 [Aphidius gifuensis]